MNQDIGELAARGLRCSGQDSGLRVSILLHGPVLGGFLSGFCFMAFFRVCFSLFLFVGLWPCLFISSAVDCPHVYTLFFSANRGPV